MGSPSGTQNKCLPLPAPGYCIFLFSFSHLSACSDLPHTFDNCSPSLGLGLLWDCRDDQDPTSLPVLCAPQAQPSPTVLHLHLEGYAQAMCSACLSFRLSEAQSKGTHVHKTFPSSPRQKRSPLALSPDLSPKIHCFCPV